MADNRAYGLEDELYDIIESADDMIEEAAEEEMEIDDALLLGDEENDAAMRMVDDEVDRIYGTTEDSNPYYVYEEE